MRLLVTEGPEPGRVENARMPCEPHLGVVRYDTLSPRNTGLAGQLEELRDEIAAIRAAQGINREVLDLLRAEMRARVDLLNAICSRGGRSHSNVGSCAQARDRPAEVGLSSRVSSDT